MKTKNLLITSLENQKSNPIPKKKNIKPILKTDILLRKQTANSLILNDINGINLDLNILENQYTNQREKYRFELNDISHINYEKRKKLDLINCRIREVQFINMRNCS